MTCCKIFSTILISSLLALSSGCGYRIGARAMMHPQIKSIAIAEVKNDTLEMLAASIMRQQLAERFMFDGALKLKNAGESDCVMYARVIKVDNQTVREDSRDNYLTYRPAVFRLTVTVEFKVVIPGSGELLVPARSVSGSAEYQILADPAISRLNALKQASYNAARLAVEYTTEAW